MVGQRYRGEAVGQVVPVPHTFANPGDEPAHMLRTFTPAGYAAYFRELPDTPPDWLEELMARYATVVTDQYAP